MLNPVRLGYLEGAFVESALLHWGQATFETLKIVGRHGGLLLHGFLLTVPSLAHNLN